MGRLSDQELMANPELIHQFFELKDGGLYHKFRPVNLDGVYYRMNGSFNVKFGGKRAGTAKRGTRIIRMLAGSYKEEDLISIMNGGGPIVSEAKKIAQAEYQIKAKDSLCEVVRRLKEGRAEAHQRARKKLPIEDPLYRIKYTANYGYICVRLNPASGRQPTTTIKPEDINEFVGVYTPDILDGMSVFLEDCAECFELAHKIEMNVNVNDLMGV